MIAAGRASLIAVVVLGVACSTTSPSADADPSAARPTSTPTVHAAATSARSPAAPTAPMVAPRLPSTLRRPPNLPQARVLRVVDGDTLDVSLDGRTERLRLIGIDTPEIVDPRKPVECFGREAHDRARALLDGQIVGLEADPAEGERDQFGRLLRYVWLPDGRLVNYVLVFEGYAHEHTFDLPYKYQDAFRAAQQDARAKRRGFWSPTTCDGDTTRPVKAPTPAQKTDQRLDCDAAYPDVCIPRPPPDLDCGDVPHRRFRVLPPDPHRFDSDRDGVGCER